VEKELVSLSTQTGFLSGLLSSIGGNVWTGQVQQGAAVLFKNLVAKHWRVPAGEADALGEATRAEVKAGLVGVAMSSARPVQAQLLTAVSAVAKEDFPDRWPGLLPELVQRMQTPDLAQVNSVLSLLHAVFKGYPSAARTDELIKELKYVLAQTQAPLLGLVTAMTAHMDAVAADPQQLALCFTSLRFLTRIFYCLNHVDLPEFFEDHLGEWMAPFHKFLSVAEVPRGLATDSDDDPDLVAQLQTSVCECINLFIGKYEEEFTPYLQAFTTDVWSLLTRTNLKPKYDALVAQAIAFLTSIAKSVHHGIFQAPETLKTICENIVVPNIRLRDADVELFEDNAVEYIRRDVEGSDSETRRRAACDLVKGLSTHYEAPVAAIFSVTISQLVAAARAAPQAEWRSKDVAVNLVVALMSKVTRTQTEAERAATAQNVLGFYDAEIAPVLAGPAANHPIVVASALKYASVFRNVLPKAAHLQALPHLVALSGSPLQVLHSYAALALERLLLMRDPAQPQQLRLLGTADVFPHLSALLTNLFGALGLECSRENEYVMKCVMRTLTFAESDIVGLVEPLLAKLNGVLERVAANPTNPVFSHYLFESTAAMVRFSCSKDPALVGKFEALLFPIFGSILQREVLEFTPYVFQIFSQILELRGSTSPAYAGMLPAILAPALWEPKGNVLPLCRLVVAYLRKGQEVVFSQGPTYFVRILGVAQSLLGSQATEAGAVMIFQGVFEHLPLAAYDAQLVDILRLLLLRLEANKAVRFIKLFIATLAMLVVKQGPSVLVQRLDAIQPRLFGGILGGVWLPNAAKVDDPVERKLCAVATGRFLYDCPEMVANENYTPLWAKTLSLSLTLVDDSQGAAGAAGAAGLNSAGSDDGEDDVFLEAPEGGYTNAYTALHNAAPLEPKDPLASCAQPKQVLRASLQTLVRSDPAKFNQLIAQLGDQRAQYIGQHLLN
jgi:exportin-2 (importin alpha re-exporter)